MERAREEMKVGVMNETLLLESMALQIRATEPRRGWQM